MNPFRIGLKSGLTLLFYTLTPAVQVVDYTRQALNLSFTTLSPGGMGQLTCTIFLSGSQLPHPELALFSRVAVMCGPDCVYLGEVSDSPSKMDNTGEYYQITALGLGNSLKDDAQTRGYVNQTAAQVIADQFSIRSAYAVIDSDQSACFPDNPVATNSPAYNDRTMEEVVSDQAIQAGNYAWGVWPYPAQPAYQVPNSAHADGAGFPTARLEIHQTDTATTHYIANASNGDIADWQITPSGERCFNVIALTYYDPTQSPPVGTVTVKDSRLGAGDIQGTAPFRRRKYAKDLSSITTINATQSTVLANTYLSQWKNITNKVNFKLRTLWDGHGAPLRNLALVRADRNILVQELPMRGNPSLLTSVSATQNQFYIVQTTYTETTSDVSLQLQCDNFADDANVQLARLTLAADGQRRNQATTTLTQAQGAPEIGWCGAGFPSVGAGVQVSCEADFKTVMTNVPTSITLTAVSTNNFTSLTTSNLTVNGFVLLWTTVGSGETHWYGDYQTNGNCLRRIGIETFDRHCDHCDSEHHELVFEDMVHTTFGNYHCVSHVCPACGAVECYNTNVSANDAAGTDHRSGQARLIRELLRMKNIPVR